MGGVGSVPLQFDAAVRRIVCTTNAIESVSARIRLAVRACGPFPSENAALECVYNGSALQAFDIAFRTARQRPNLKLQTHPVTSKTLRTPQSLCGESCESSVAAEGG